MKHELFGSDSAENDQLLYDCTLEKWKKYDQPILTGRWGTGKTAALFLANRELSEALERSESGSSKCWYLDERTIDILHLQKLAYDHQHDRRLFLRILENLWLGEIIRTHCVVLEKLHKYYGEPKGSHWTAVVGIAKMGKGVNSIWKSIPELSTVIFGKDLKRNEAITDIQTIFENAISDKLINDLQKCLKDIETYPVQPITVIEPIETPGSNIEKESGLAVNLVTALLNVFERHFRPRNDQLINVRISIPWHRWEQKTMDFPQKVFEHVGVVKWSEQDLKEFIELRIDWELRRVSRRNVPKYKTGSISREIWNILFDDSVQNIHCKPEISEESFRYILRHTHHRARDIQRLARLAVVDFQNHIQIAGASVDDVLSGKYGKVSSYSIRDAVRNIGHKLTGELKAEAVRRYPDLESIISLLIGIQVPFKEEQLKRRIGDSYDIRKVYDALWSSGILGLEIPSNCEDAENDPRLTLDSEYYRCYQRSDGSKTTGSWYLFEYNWEGQISETMIKYNTNANLILHPKTFEYIKPSTTKDRPIGT